MFDVDKISHMELEGQIKFSARSLGKLGKLHPRIFGGPWTLAICPTSTSINDDDNDPYDIPNIPSRDDEGHDK